MEAIRTENIRLANNIMMSIHYAGTIESAGRWALSLGFVAAWATTLDVQEFQRGSRLLQTSQIRPWLMKNYTRLCGQQDQVSEADMDEAAELLVGGSLTGVIITGSRRSSELELCGSESLGPFAIF
jgi:hypothetical protein